MSDRMKTSRSALVGERLRLLRTRALLSQLELADLSGVSRGTIQNIESGRTEPHGATLRLLGTALSLDGRDIEWLVTSQDVSIPAPGPALTPNTMEAPFVGRDAEVAEIAAALANPATRLLTLTGPGGIGKTRLAIEAAAAAADRFPAVDIVPLANLADPGEVLPAIAAALRLPPAAGPILDQVAAALHGQRRLLVLDNLEHLLPAASDISRLLRTTPGPVVLATSREVLRIPGESAMVVAPLSTAGADSPAADLFLRLARRSMSASAFRVLEDAGDDDAIHAICALLGGFPLALELAAAQMNVLAPATLLALMRDAGLGALGSTQVDETRRFSSMDSAIAWSVDRLSPDDQRLLRTLAVFPDGYGTDAASAVMASIGAAADASPARVAAALVRLTHAHLVQSRPRPSATGRAAPHFTMLEPIRLFALDRLREAGEEAAARRAHAEYAASRFATLDRLVHEDRMALVEQIEREYPNGRDALDWALDTGDFAIASRLISSLKYVHSFRYRAAGIASQLDRLMERSTALTPHARLWAHYHRAELASREGNLARLREVLLAAIDDAQATADPLLEAMALLYWSCDLDEAPEATLATIARAGALLGDGRDTTDPSFLQAWLLIRQGVELHRLGRLLEARAALEAGIARKTAEGLEVGNGPPLAHLGRLLHDLGLPREAAETLLAALDHAETLSDRWLRFHAARWLADVARGGGPEAREIAALLDAALAAEYAAHAYALDPADAPVTAAAAPPPLPPPLQLPDAIALARRLPSLLPERSKPTPRPTLSGLRLE